MGGCYMIMSLFPFYCEAGIYVSKGEGNLDECRLYAWCWEFKDAPNNMFFLSIHVSLVTL